MNITRDLLLGMFGRPQGVLGRLGGVIMARTNKRCGTWVIELLQITPTDAVLELGFGPGVIIERISQRAATTHVAGVDASSVMVKQARIRNAAAIETGQVDVRQGSVEDLSFRDNTFDKALAVNSMQVWTDALAGLREVRRVLKPAATLALGFTAYSGQSKAGLRELLSSAGYTTSQVLEKENWFCVLASK